eukprot:Protomagalhaensia_wolfi_Nauph_80__319@NODE_1179_length_1675_cov_190_026895_g903_i0_p2_GENE_NODE_1179_length_1675_cov_190_026895_g903_i0NODE_1179_length_1675_cov_190_026895_g903_i0_p2_ORF_typecomplete_len211_score38_54GST_N/PF02798_20/1_6e13GST_N_3/PF13417_6/2_2e08GST_N_3/PF13417_6/1_6e04GST_C_3/PF14497_6/0_00011Tom37/PF10568_9/0_14GST_N_4/PF17172_4/0_28_NODE_1179_length_1675_cov_190_026895_g903_i086718
MSKPILYYFDIPGRAEPIRCAFVGGGIPFEDRRISRGMWVSEYKALSPNGQLPMLEVDGRLYVESRAILSYACSLSGNIPVTPLETLAHEAIVDKMDEVYPMSKPLYEAKTPEERMNALPRVNAKLVEFMEQLEAMVSQSIVEGGHIVKGKPFCPADLQLWFSVRGLNSHMWGIDVGDIKTKYPSIQAVHDAVERDNPRIVEYKAPSKSK